MAEENKIKIIDQITQESGLWVYADRIRLKQVILNLLSNAVKYNREGGLVALSAEETPERIVVRVRDTGLGIHKTEVRRIFEKFYRSEDDEAQKRGGHGLGLSLSKEIVELHGGEIELETTPGEGSQFSISLKKTAALTRERAQS